MAMTAGQYRDVIRQPFGDAAKFNLTADRQVVDLIMVGSRR
jgi:hypothetical protein